MLKLFYILMRKVCLCSYIMMSPGCFDELGFIWHGRDVAVSFSFKSRSSRTGWRPKRKSFIVLSSSNLKRDPLLALRHPPNKILVGTMFLPGLESQCTTNVTTGTHQAPNAWSIILKPAHTTLHICVNISFV
ncbi:hypothetical protein XENOCAPTIV_009637 [Xenoophorus captivus]|uniref:Secreted protein n=1 Tax=Xenoophorus captivus TaxID=1517983 RepID=A0ABV0Q903_9TELE